MFLQKMVRTYSAARGYIRKDINLNNNCHDISYVKKIIIKYTKTGTNFWKKQFLSLSEINRVLGVSTEVLRG